MYFFRACRCTDWFVTYLSRYVPKTPSIYILPHALADTRIRIGKTPSSDQSTESVEHLRSRNHKSGSLLFCMYTFSSIFIRIDDQTKRAHLAKKKKKKKKKKKVIRLL